MKPILSVKMSSKSKLLPFDLNKKNKIKSKEEQGLFLGGEMKRDGKGKERARERWRDRREGEIEERWRDRREGEIEERWDEEMKKRRAQQRSRRRSFRMR